jgi:hypothetical protein
VHFVTDKQEPAGASGLVDEQLRRCSRGDSHNDAARPRLSEPVNQSHLPVGLSGSRQVHAPAGAFELDFELFLPLPGDEFGWCHHEDGPVVLADGPDSGDRLARAGGVGKDSAGAVVPPGRQPAGLLLAELAAAVGGPAAGPSLKGFLFLDQFLRPTLRILHGLLRIAAGRVLQAALRILQLLRR